MVVRAAPQRPFRAFSSWHASVNIPFVWCDVGARIFPPALPLPLFFLLYCLGLCPCLRRLYYCSFLSTSKICFCVWPIASLMICWNPGNANVVYLSSPSYLILLAFSTWCDTNELVSRAQIIYEQRRTQDEAKGSGPRKKPHEKSVCGTWQVHGVGLFPPQFYSIWRALGLWENLIRGKTGVMG